MTNRRRMKVESFQRLMNTTPAQKLDSELARLRETVEHLSKILYWLNPLLRVETAEFVAQSQSVVSKSSDETRRAFAIRDSQRQLEIWDNEGGKIEYVAR